MLPSFHHDLQARLEAAGPIIVGLVGAGQMGADLSVQLRAMAGVRLGAIAVRQHVDGATAAALEAGYERDEINFGETPQSVDIAIDRGQVCVTTNLDALLQSGRIEVVIDATGHPETGALVGLAAIRGGKHIIMMNVEADVTIGRYLNAEARAAGVVYSGAAGDEPCAALELINFARALGFEVVAAGKGKNNAFDVSVTADNCHAEALRRNMNPRVLAEFVDGTKTMVEMVALANASGLEVDCPGMHGPDASLEQLADLFALRSEGGLLTRRGVVDFSLGRGVAPGVFCVVRPKHPRIIERLADLHVGKGPQFTLHRPYHLTSVETPLSAIRAVLYGRADIEPLDRPVAEVGAVAKRQLAQGDRLGRIGEADYRGWAMSWSDAQRLEALPLGLAERAIVTKTVKWGELLSWSNCAVDPSLAIVRCRAEMDRRLHGAPEPLDARVAQRV